MGTNNSGCSDRQALLFPIRKTGYQNWAYKNYQRRNLIWGRLAHYKPRSSKSRSWNAARYQQRALGSWK